MDATLPTNAGGWGLPSLACSRSKGQGGPKAADALAVAYSCAAIALLLILGVLAWTRRATLYVQLRQPRWMLAHTLSGAVWLLASVVAHDHAFARPGGCTLWSFWLEYVAGAAAWAACVLVALDAAHCAFNGGRAQRARRRWFVFAGAVVPAAAAAAIASLHPAEPARPCSAPLVARVVLIGALAADYAWAVGLVAATYRARPHFPEYRALLQAVLLTGLLSLPIAWTALRSEAARATAATLVMVFEATLVVVFELVSTLPLFVTRADARERWFTLEEEAAPFGNITRALGSPFARFHFFAYVRTSALCATCGDAAAVATDADADAAAAGGQLVDAYERITWWAALDEAARCKASLAVSEQLQTWLAAYDAWSVARHARCPPAEPARAPRRLLATLENTWGAAAAGRATAFDKTRDAAADVLATYYDVYVRERFQDFFERQSAVLDENRALRADFGS